ncbi:hypothetical protein BU25DRAFT_108162 [Macroventuria anomochaeta]|uniref:Uncharacterized protein n=1 Tax=Macroventuria anomochaeta TaxID=301207 RepID=A0ACB6RWX6_9PLEO|nr:uncharacterized protein BU25DRAFT_108162 [Macroventuria anomochaeta]KAF2625643.1 hypothetical protein BU25DRAFT_108162 [Macroventuria anomochaeta]
MPTLLKRNVSPINFETATEMMPATVKLGSFSSMLPITRARRRASIIAVAKSQKCRGPGFENLGLCTILPKPRRPALWGLVVQSVVALSTPEVCLP